MNIMKVYIVATTTGIYCDIDKLIVFSSLEKAKEFKEEHDDEDEYISSFIYEREVDDDR